MGELVLRLERVVPVAPPVAFAAFTEAQQLARWWGPEGFEVPALDFSPRSGARYRIEMQPPEGEAFALTGEFAAVEPPQRLAFTFAWEPPDPEDVETLADVEFDDLGDSTRITLTQSAFATEDRLSLHRDGWSDSFDRLERLLSG